VGDAFSTSGVQISVGDFTFTNGGTTSSGFTEVEAGGQAGGSGQELEVNNVLLAIDLGGPVQGLSIRFGEYGGNLNLEVNGDFRNFDDFADVDGTNIGGAGISVTNGPRNDQGIVTLTGTIDAISVGGKELWIDDVCSAATTPGSPSNRTKPSTRASVIGIPGRKTPLRNRDDNPQARPVPGEMAEESAARDELQTEPAKLAGMGCADCYDADHRMTRFGRTS
jgi:hypothetical protein